MNKASGRWLSRLLGRDAAPAAAGRAEIDAWMREGYAHQQAGRAAEAERAYRRILAADPDYTDAEFFIGTLTEADGRLDEALAHYRKALKAQPQQPAFLFALGRACHRARRFDEAVEVLARGLALEPGDADARNDLGMALIELGRCEEAVDALEPFASGHPEIFAAHHNLGTAYRQLGRIDDAIACYRRALELDPGHFVARHCLLFVLNYSDKHSAEEIAAEHRAFGERHSRPLPPPSRDLDLRWPRRLRVGYLSPDFRRHSVARFIAPVLARHDREEFEITCYYTHTDQDEETARLRSSVEHWSDCAGLSDEDLADRIRARRIDILVDLAGHTSGHRLGVLALKPAPIQMTYLGYPNTTGLPAVDYRITDARADPPGPADALHAERLLRLPGPFHCYRPEAHAPEPGALPMATNGHVTFGCFNNVLKMSDTFLDLAARVLKAVPASRLVLKGGPLESASIIARFRARFAAAGVAPERVDLRGWTTAVGDHLAAYREIDVALDSFPYHGTTTTCEALWMGVPVVTLRGDRHAARVGASLLGALGLDHLVAGSPDEFVDLCRRLAADRDGLAALRASLRERMRASPLMDEAGFTRALERCYKDAWTDYRNMQDAPLRLHIGGRQVKEGWKILNVQPGAGVDYVGDCRDLSQFASGAVERIYASHVLEHLSYKEGLPRALEEFRRVLRPGGMLQISVPDFEVLCRLFLDPEATLEQRFHVMRMAFGGQADAHDFHYVGFSEEILRRFLEHAGFTRVERVAEFGLFDDASSLRFGDTLISLNVVACR